MTNDIISDSTKLVETEQPIKYASSVMRLVANIIDFIILALAYTALKTIIGTGFFQEIINAVLIMAFYLCFWNKRQATPGKMIFSMKIIDEKTLAPASKEKYLLRFLILYAPFLITLIINSLINSIFDNWKIFSILFSSIFTILTLTLAACFISIFLSKKKSRLT